jgi:hypothetical protein
LVIGITNADASLARSVLDAHSSDYIANVGRRRVSDIEAIEHGVVRAALAN